MPLVLAAAALAACGGGDHRDAATPLDGAQTRVATSTPGLAQGSSATVRQAPATSPAQPLPSQPAVPPAQQPQPVEQTPSAQPAGQPSSTLNPDFAGVWRVYSARIFYDEGGGGTVDTTITRELELGGDGAWYFGSSSGTYEVSDVSADDWTRWAVDPYGPTRKITLFDWGGGVADGPIEESGGVVDFLWAIYHEGPPTIGAPGTVWMKFGHA